MKKILTLICLLFFSSFFPAFSQGIITTVAGGGNGGDGSLATNAHLTAPNDVVVDDSGNLYIALETAIRKVDAQTQIISLYAGSYQPGFGCDGCPATQGKLSHASAIAFDPQGNLHIADWGTSRIRKVDALTGMMTTVAGNGSFGYSGDGGAATQAQLSKPMDIAFDGSGNLYIADERYVIRRVDAQTGVITTLAGDGVKGTWNDGDTAVKAQIGRIRGICFDKMDNVYFADLDNHRIGKINSFGILSVYGGNGTLGNTGEGGLAISAQIGAGTKVRIHENGDLFFTDFSVVKKIDAASGILVRAAGNGIYGFSGDGGSPLQAQLASSNSVCFDADGNMFIADSYNYRIRKIIGFTGVEDIKRIGFVVYPNPSSGVFIICSEDNINKIEIRNLIGQIVYQANVDQNKILANIASFSDGIYTITVFSGEGTASKKVLLHH